MKPDISMVPAALAVATEEEVRALDQQDAGLDLSFMPNAGPDDPVVPDLILSVADHVFWVILKSYNSTDQIRLALYDLIALAGGQSRPGSPLLVVPHMSEFGKTLCRHAGISWLDLSGNADIRVERLRVRVEGKPNQFKRMERHTDLFAPRASRLARALLSNPGREFNQRQLVNETGLSAGTISQMVRRYEQAAFIERERDGVSRRIRLSDGDTLLDAWHEAYDFSQHNIRAGHIPARSGREGLSQITGAFTSRGVEYAATGLAAAWLLEPFASFRLVTVYVKQWPDSEVMSELSVRDDPKGANVWFVLPKDEGVFYGSGQTDGTKHVNQVQVYLDLKGQAERSEEAAGELRRRRLNWGNE
ncbi:MAG: type IV toxin-antitoxin system AbiEi family antitoxin [Armatimonadota bacterium]